MTYQLIVIGASYGGTDALSRLLPSLSNVTNLPIIIVQHMKASFDSFLANQLNNSCKHHVKEARDGDVIREGAIYIAPGDYHVLVENNRTLALSKDTQVKFARPSIDVLFQSASDVFKSHLIGLLLTGANDDGAEGIFYINRAGGITIVQDPSSAVMPIMPKAAISKGGVDKILSLDEMPSYIKQLVTDDVTSKE